MDVRHVQCTGANFSASPLLGGRSDALRGVVSDNWQAVHASCRSFSALQHIDGECHCSGYAWLLISLHAVSTALTRRSTLNVSFHQNTSTY
jgi:hypothetical protein